MGGDLLRVRLALSRSVVALLVCLKSASAAVDIAASILATRRLEHDGRRIDDFILLGRRPNYPKTIPSVPVH